MAVDVAGNVYVADSARGSEKIVRLGTDGVQSIIRIAELRNPTDLRFDAAGNLYVVDSWAERIVRIAPNGTEETIPPGDLDHPFAVHVDQAGTITVSNRAESVGIIRLDANGSRTTLPFTGLDQPTGLDIDAAGNVYVAQSGQSGTYGARILKLTPSGEQSVVPFARDALYRPMGIVVRDGFITVADQLGFVEQLAL
ncbi:hypothetical protein [Nocardia ninae]|uniref:hypothetical protein n=1 Tax=Nocardia ninae TaxID=356145 RepID=UPI001FE6246E|nr:hypothetical protein [Nocardia ninae]